MSAGLWRDFPLNRKRFARGRCVIDSLLDDYEDTGEVGRPRREPVEPLDAGQAEALIATGPRGRACSCSAETACSSR